MKIILGSKSPRRQQLLRMTDIEFTCETRDASEAYPDTLKGEQIPLFIARKKAEAFGSIGPDTLLITADTIVHMGQTVYGKPKDEDDARRILSELSGRTHQVITGVCLTTSTIQRSFAVSTDVRFATLSPDEIDYYITHYHPTDKAGAYGIQEWIGAIGVEHISGSYFNVMGLPVRRLWKELKDMGAI